MLPTQASASNRVERLAPFVGRSRFYCSQPDFLAQCRIVRTKGTWVFGKVEVECIRGRDFRSVCEPLRKDMVLPERFNMADAAAGPMNGVRPCP